MANHSVSTLANSAAATESIPAAISGEFVATVVPSTSNSNAEIVAAVGKGSENGHCAISQKNTFCLISYRGFASLPASNEAAMERNDGLSNSSVDGSRVRSRSLSCVESSVAPTESRPADMSGTSDKTAVPLRSITVSTRRPKT